MTFGSLFAGIGGMDLGLERSGMRCVWQCEIDPYCRRVLEKHWPTVRRHDDVRTFPPPEGDWGCDLIAGGFPCQDISNAGRRAGITGSRSGLWSEYSRIIRLLRPRFVLVENSAALLGRGMGTVVGDMAECGYDAEWDCLPAAAFGAVHIRNRVFLLAYPNGQQRQERRHSGLGRSNARKGLLKRIAAMQAKTMYTTPCADDTGHRKKPYSQGGEALSFQIGGPVNPPWEEWLMGFPMGWTDVGALAMPSCPKSPSTLDAE